MINNVGIYGPQDFFDTPDDVWQHFFDVTVMSAALRVDGGVVDTIA
ncbi:MAG TPA: hypothetical protein VGC62_14390 [Pseudomonas sp.]